MSMKNHVGNAKLTLTSGIKSVSKLELALFFFPIQF